MAVQRFDLATSVLGCWAPTRLPRSTGACWRSLRHKQQIRLRWRDSQFDRPGHRPIFRAAMKDIEEAPSCCIPADGNFCPGCSWQDDTCYNGECEGLHLPVEERKQHAQWLAPEHQQVIIAAGPERSGSTWLFNAVRLLLKHAHIPYDPYWITTLTTDKLQHRKRHAHGRYVVIKTHCWSDEWDTKEADYIFLTHRDLSGVVASYKRVGWAFKIPDSYVQEHQQWQDVADEDVAYENIMNTPEAQLHMLSQALNITRKVNIADVNKELQSLKPANRGGPDPVSKLWPNHYSAAVQKKHEEGCTPLPESEQGVSKASASKQSGSENLKKRFPEYYSQYGYD
ncbi:TPA: hypothetical protein ACH3X1_003571 [Trebouxia sp. C0004]